MLKNLIESWAALAPDEVTLSKDCTELSLRRNTEEHGIIVIETTEPLLVYEQDALQGYIQRCIDARIGWYWLLVSGENYVAKVYHATVFVDGSEFLVTDGGSAVSSLLAAYVTALAAQRAIAPGLWQHFKGGVVEVIGEASWASGQYDGGYVPLVQADFIDKFSLSEEPSRAINLYQQNEVLFYISEMCSDFANRVFYSCDSGNWARKTDTFLGLVGSEYSEHEGLLRFVEVGE